jgi:hypothetical protein
MGARASIVAAIGIGLVAGPAEAAEITVNNPDQDGRVFVDVVGDIEVGDDKTFRAKVGVLADPEKVVVTLTSDGGHFLTAFLVGDHIRLTGMTTFVPAGKTCASACAFVWLAGRPRTSGGGARIGFHGVYDARTGQQLGMPNALLGTYLGYLGFSYDAVIWMVSAQPGAMHWLTAETALPAACSAVGTECTAARAIAPACRCTAARAIAAALTAETATGSSGARFTPTHATRSERSRRLRPAERPDVEGITGCHRWEVPALDGLGPRRSGRR